MWLHAHHKSFEWSCLRKNWCCAIYFAVLSLIVWVFVIRLYCERRAWRKYEFIQRRDLLWNINFGIEVVLRKVLVFIWFHSCCRDKVGCFLINARAIVLLLRITVVFAYLIFVHTTDVLEFVMYSTQQYICITRKHKISELNFIFYRQFIAFF